MFTYSPAHGGSVAQHCHFLGLLVSWCIFPSALPPQFCREREISLGLELRLQHFYTNALLFQMENRGPQSRCESGLLNYLFYSTCVDCFQKSRSGARLTVHCGKWAQRKLPKSNGRYCTRRMHFVEKRYPIGKTVTTYGRGKRVERAPKQMEEMREACQSK